jgi:hypothetical protein
MAGRRLFRAVRSPRFALAHAYRHDAAGRDAARTRGGPARALGSALRERGWIRRKERCHSFLARPSLSGGHDSDAHLRHSAALNPNDANTHPEPAVACAGRAEDGIGLSRPAVALGFITHGIGTTAIALFAARRYGEALDINCRYAKGGRPPTGAPGGASPARGGSTKRGEAAECCG